MEKNIYKKMSVRTLFISSMVLTAFLGISRLALAGCGNGSEGGENGADPHDPPIPFCVEETIWSGVCVNGVEFGTRTYLAPSRGDNDDQCLTETISRSCCSCSAAEDNLHCEGPYLNSCGASCVGTIKPDCSERGNYCDGVVFPSPNGCGTCDGTKDTNYGPGECTLLNLGDVCNPGNCGNSVINERAYCVKKDLNNCGPQRFVDLDECSSCSSSRITCPSCNWIEVNP